MGCVLSTDRERPVDEPAAQPASAAATTADASPSAHETKVVDAAAGLLGLRGLRRWRHVAFSADLQRLRNLARGDCSESLTFSPRALKFFVSSTFTDTAAERDALNLRVYPKVRARAREKRVTFEAAEMRWGIRAEASDDNQTEAFCLRKLEECRRESGGLFFLSVWADKYGFCPLPRELDAARMDGLRSEMVAEQERRFDACYVRDENAVPPEYVLRSGVTSKHWDDFSTLRRDLRSLASKAGWDAAEVRAKFVRSITETESEVALEGLQPGGDLPRIVWLRRHFRGPEEGVPQIQKLDRPWDWVDMDGKGLDEEKRAMQQEYLGRGGTFQRKLDALTTTAEVHEFEAEVSFDAKASPHLDEMCSKAEALLTAQVDRIAAKADGWEAAVRAEMRLQPASLAEMLHHAAWWREKASAFYGRDEALETVLQRLHGERVVAVVGSSGCGKTALCAKVAERLAAAAGGSGGVTMVRFLGTSSRSRRVEDVVRSLGEQWVAAGVGDGASVPSSPAELPDALGDLLELMGQTGNGAMHLIVLDSLDQLDQVNESRSKLRWLPLSAETIPANVRILLSCLPDDGEYNYGCETRLTKLGVPMVRLGGLGEADAAGMIDGTLASARRTLTGEQRDAVRRALGVAPTALFCKLTLGRALRWPSWESSALTLGSSVPDAIDAVFDRLEGLHGATLVRHALGLLAACRRGLSSEEMLDVLSLDDDVLRDVFEWWMPSVVRLPAGVWLALRQEIGGLLVGGDGPLRWYHRQLHEAAEKRYGCPTERRERVLVAYWSGEWSGDRAKPFELKAGAGDSLKDACAKADARRQVAAQPLLLAGAWLADPRSDGCLVNARRGEELAFQLLRCGQAARAGAELAQGLTYAEVRLRAGHGYDYVRELLEAAAAPGTGADVEECLRLVRGSASLLVRRPETLRHVALQAPMASKLYREAWAQRSGGGQRSDDWARARVTCATMPKVVSAGAWLQTLEGHSDVVMSVALSADGSRIVSGSDDKTVRVWDAASGECVQTLEGHSGGVMSVAVSADGSRIVSGSDDKTVRVWDAASGECVQTLEGHSGGVMSVAVSADGSRIVSGSDDKTVRVWDAASGECVQTLEGHSGEVNSVAVSADGSTR